ncbi:unnamed protein product [Mytilus edulis]|uniref:Uncharacterized protein n=1 Tax=Mytilus edulis TaxID=6550 RepID=A0A8S3VCM0_MYTED|nr:unnamed protein product [Mytilus edulis]
MFLCFQSDPVEAADNTDDDDNYADAASDFKKLQLDVLDTVRMYDHTDESPAIPDREPVTIETQSEVVKKIEHEHEPEKEKEIESLVKKAYVNVFQENYENTTPKIASEDIETPKVDVDPTPALTVQQRRASFEKTASQSHTELSNSKRISDSALKHPVNQTKSVPNKIEHSVLPEVTPRTTLISQNTPPSGPQFASARPIEPSVVSSTPPPQMSGPRFAGPVSPQTSVVENQPKFVSVINCTKTDSTITQGNRPKKQIGHQGSVKKSKSAAGGDNYELAQPIEEQSRNSSNHVTVNSESVYAVPDKGNGKTTHAVPDRGNVRSTHAVQDSVYSEVNKSSSLRSAPKDSAYETIAVTQSLNSAPKGRQYEEVVLPLDGEYSAVGDISALSLKHHLINDAPAIPKREYDDPEPTHDTVKASTSMTDKLKSKITTTFFNINPKSSGSSENTDSKASTIPGFNERIEKKVKGPRTMPWAKKHKS